MRRHLGLLVGLCTTPHVPEAYPRPAHKRWMPRQPVPSRIHRLLASCPMSICTQRSGCICCQTAGACASAYTATYTALLEKTVALHTELASMLELSRAVWLCPGKSDLSRRKTSAACISSRKQALALLGANTSAETSQLGVPLCRDCASTPAGKKDKPGNT